MVALGRRTLIWESIYLQYNSAHRAEATRGSSWSWWKAKWFCRSALITAGFSETTAISGNETIQPETRGVENAACWEGRFSMQHLTLCISSSLSGRQSFWGWYMTCLKVKFTVCCWTHRETGKKLDPPQIFTLFQRWCNIWLIRTLLIADLILVRQSMWGWMHSEWLIKSLILTQISKVLWITVVSTAKAIYLTYAVLWKLITFSIKA